MELLGGAITLGAIYIFFVRPIIDFHDDRRERSERNDKPVARDTRPIYTCHNLAGPTAATARYWKNY